jgi:hypothetical protein
MSSFIGEFGEAYIQLLKAIEKIPNDAMKENYFDITKNIVGPLSNLIQSAYFAKGIDITEFESLKSKLGIELKTFNALKTKMKEDWNW